MQLAAAICNNKADLGLKSVVKLFCIIWDCGSALKSAILVTNERVSNSLYALTSGAHL